MAGLFGRTLRYLKKVRSTYLYTQKLQFFSVIVATPINRMLIKEAYYIFKLRVKLSYF